MKLLFLFSVQVAWDADKREPKTVLWQDDDNELV